MRPQARFDVVVGNPPYQESKDGQRKDQASNLWSKFWVRGIELSADNGIVALVTPTSWLSPSADLRGDDRYGGMNRLWDVFESFTSRANVTDVARHFPGVGSSFGYVVVDKGGRDGLEFTDGRDTSLGFMPVSGAEVVSRQLSKDGNLGSIFPINQSNTTDLRVSIPMTRRLDHGSIEILRGDERPTQGSEKDGLYLYVHVETDGQAEAVRSRLRECLPILNDHCRWNGFLNIRATKMVRFHGSVD